MRDIYFSPEDRVINPCWDNVFKAVFTKETAVSQGALKGLLSAVLGRAVISVQVITNEPG
ncbi:MAG: hypothetical protein LBG73_08640 [Spirochaetaceae bacterium]|jgi:hypothetical protein|nr:hypothetical protein [Spirochaetaceae bacterium]